MVFQKNKIIFILMLICGLLNPMILNGCPAFVDLEKVPFSSGYRPVDLRYYTIKDGKLDYPPFRIEPRNKQKTKIIFSNNRWKSAPFEAQDRIVIEPDQFGAIDSVRGFVPPKRCKSPRRILRIKNKIQPNRGGYLAFCGRYSPKLRGFRKNHTILVSHEPAKRRINSSLYQYQYSLDNKLLFDQIKDQSSNEIFAVNSDLKIFADIRYFFSLLFDSKDIESEIQFVRSDPLGVEAKINFYLKILFFRLKLSLATDVSFYKDSVYIPMVIYLPTNPAKRLRNGSGIWYYWSFEKALDQRSIEVEMPLYLSDHKTNLQVGSGQGIERAISKHCVKKSCHFQINFPFQKKTFVMSFRLPLYLLKEGFFPMYHGNLDNISKVYRVPQAEHSGIYFETSKLSQGRHPWDYWMKVASDSGKNTPCPHPVEIEEIKPRGF